MWPHTRQLDEHPSIIGSISDVSPKCRIHWALKGPFPEVMWLQRQGHHSPEPNTEITNGSWCSPQLQGLYSMHGDNFIEVMAVQRYRHLHSGFVNMKTKLHKRKGGHMRHDFQMITHKHE